MYTLNTKYLGEDISLSWSNIDELKKYARAQLGRYYFPPDMPNEQFFKIFEQKVLLNWKRTSLNLDLKNINRIVDVGSGIAVPDLLFSQYNKDAEFYLVDKSEFSGAPAKYFDNIHPGYNSWDVIEDCINSSGIDRNRFNFLSPDHDWPNDVDLVVSTYSWCWHYPKDTYWSKVQSSLRVGGKLAVDILFRPDRDIVKEISDEFDSEPVILPTRLPNSPFKDQFAVADDGSCGGFYIWTKNK